MQKCLADLVGQLSPDGMWLPVARSADIEVWRRDEDVWEHTEPPEDRALPPMIKWGEALRALVLAIYRVENDETLEPGQYYDISWPPEGYLTTDGSWYWRSGDECSEHEYEYASDCAECRDLDQAGSVVIENQAQWNWTVQIQTWERTTLDDGRVVHDELDRNPWDDWMIGSTLIDPREVEYGPARDDPRRQLLYMERGRIAST